MSAPTAKQRRAAKQRDALGWIRNASRKSVPPIPGVFKCSSLGQSPRYPENHFIVREGPLAVIRQCMHCAHHEIVRKGLRNVGRGYGMREGNKARGRIIQHIKSAHADKLTTGTK